MSAAHTRDDLERAAAAFDEARPSWPESVTAMYDPTGATTPSRHAERASYDAASVHEILDEALICHVGFVADERPQVLPMLFVRVGSTVFLHASTGAHMARMAARRAGSRSPWR